MKKKIDKENNDIEWYQKNLKKTFSHDDNVKWIGNMVTSSGFVKHR